MLINIESQNKEEVLSLLHSIRRVLIDLEALSTKNYAPEILTITDFIDQLKDNTENG